MLPLTAGELKRPGFELREFVADGGGFQWRATSEALPELTEQQIQLAHQHELARAERDGGGPASAPGSRAGSAT